MILKSDGHPQRIGRYSLVQISASCQQVPYFRTKWAEFWPDRRIGVSQACVTRISIGPCARLWIS
jgi:hypothetical protein